MIRRHLFKIVSDTGVTALVTKGDTGFFSGEIMQIAVTSNVAGDSGDFEVAFIPGGKTAAGAQLDTGINGFFVASGPFTGAAMVRRVPRQPLNGLSTAGTDTGGAPVVGCMDKLRVKVRSGRVAGAGLTMETLIMVWVRDNV
jgi:hypothetical protein